MNLSQVKIDLESNLQKMKEYLEIDGDYFHD